MFGAVFAPKKHVIDPLLLFDTGIAVVIWKDRAIRGDHVEHPFAARAQVNAVGAAGKTIWPPPLRQGLTVQPSAPDRGDRGLYGALDDHRAGGKIGQIGQSTAKTVAIPLGHVLIEGRQLHCDGDLTALARGLKLGGHQCR